LTQLQHLLESKDAQVNHPKPSGLDLASSSQVMNLLYAQRAHQATWQRLCLGCAGDFAMQFKLNGKSVDLDVEPDMPLLWAIRNEAGLNGTKYGCGVAQCGACTVLLDGEPVRACGIPVAVVSGRKVTTIEGLGGKSALQKAWIEKQVPQCGYCQSGMLMAATALLARKPRPTDADIDAAITNLCRCGTYPRIKSAIKAAAKI
jgi:isoquinoline 1-oxidoreductase alpha subunit